MDFKQIHIHNLLKSIKYNQEHLIFRCNNKNHCEISASDYNFGPDPCPDTERYLEAHYICVQRKSYVTTGKNIGKVLV